jgi:CspA family cold shock protein
VAEDLSSLHHVSGRVKWFDPVKGFGFIVSDDGEEDILLHVNVLRNFGQSSVAEGTQIEIVTHRTDRGVQALEIVRLDPPEREQVGPVLTDFAHLSDDDLDLLDLEPARVKWFDKGKGFGFANVFGRPEDVFLHVEVLRQSGLSDLQPGEALALRVIDGKRGRMAAEILSWDANLDDDDLPD